MSTADATGDITDREHLREVLLAAHELATRIARVSDEALRTGDWTILEQLDVPAAHATLEAMRAAARANR